MFDTLRKQLKQLIERVDELEDEIARVRKMAKRTENKVYHSKFEADEPLSSSPSTQTDALNKIWGK